MKGSFGRFFILIALVCTYSACKLKTEEFKTEPDHGVFIIPASVSQHPFPNHKTDKAPAKGMIYVPSGKIDLTDPNTRQSVSIYIKEFYLDSNEVTRIDFEKFVTQTGFKTDAEKFGNAGVFDMDARTWGMVDGADWHHPMGKDKPEAKELEPVTQISWFDAKAYCAWLHKRLPNELEWEHAARNAINDQTLYSWGSDWETDERVGGNVWQGEFPAVYKNIDGFESVAPVGSFRSSPLGFKDLSGNVWEWCDNWRFEYDQLTTGYFYPATEKAMRGGSFLCAPNYCHGYKISSRSFTTPETSLFHVGCRCAKDVE